LQVVLHIIWKQGRLVDCYPTFWILFLIGHQGTAELILWLCCTNVNIPYLKN
jgi:hypothetical protein